MRKLIIILFTMILSNLTFGEVFTLENCTYEKAKLCSVKIAVKEKIILVFINNHSKVKVEIYFEKKKAQFINPYWGLDERQNKALIIGGIKVWVNNKNVYIPYTFVSGIANPKTVTGYFLNGNNKFILEIKGGDASTSYICEYMFIENQLIYRKISSAEFYDEVWELQILKTF